MSDSARIGECPVVRAAWARCSVRPRVLWSPVLSTSDGDNPLQPERLRARCPQAWDRFYRQQAVPIWRLAFSRLRESAGADDVASEVFLAAVTGIDRFDPTCGSLEQWLFGIARRRIADRLRRLYRERRRLGPQPLGWELSQGPVQDPTVPRRVRLALAALPAAQRDVLIWMHQEHLSVRQIADRLGRTEKAAENLLYRARLRFKQTYQASPELEPWEPMPPTAPSPVPMPGRSSR